MKIIEVINGSECEFEILRFGEIKKGDVIIIIDNGEAALTVAKNDDYPSDYGSFILQPSNENAREWDESQRDLLYPLSYIAL